MIRERYMIRGTHRCTLLETQKKYPTRDSGRNRARNGRLEIQRGTRLEIQRGTTARDTEKYTARDTERYRARDTRIETQRGYTARDTERHRARDTRLETQRCTQLEAQSEVHS